MTELRQPKQKDWKVAIQTPEIENSEQLRKDRYEGSPTPDISKEIPMGADAIRYSQD